MAMSKSIISVLVAVLVMSGIVMAFPSPAVAEGVCPCDFTLSGREIRRKFFACNSGAFHVADWDGSRTLSVFKWAKGGQEYGSLAKSFQITDREVGNDGNPSHICGTYSRWPKNGGAARSIVESTITSRDDWDACLANLSAFSLGLANPDTDPINSCDPTRLDINVPDKYEYVGNGQQERLLPPPPVDSF